MCMMMALNDSHEVWQTIYILQYFDFGFNLYGFHG